MTKQFGEHAKGRTESELQFNQSSTVPCPLQYTLSPVTGTHNHNVCNEALDTKETGSKLAPWGIECCLRTQKSSSQSDIARKQMI